MIKEKIIELFKQLTNKEQAELLNDLDKKKSQTNNLQSDINKCHYCQSEAIIKHGKTKGQQRYMCKSCKRTFTAITGTFMHHVKKKVKMLEYGKILETEGLHTIAYMSMKIGISIPTSFEWRHKLLLSTPKKKDKFEGDTQMDDLWFLYSQKGRKGLKYSRKRGGSKHRGDNDFQVKIIAASDTADVEMRVAKIGRISKNDVVQVVGNKFKKSQKLVTDGHSSYKAFAKEAKLEHVSFIAKDHVAKTGENVQYINNLAGRLNTHINHISRGVSTKYLQLYSSYFGYVEKNIFNVTSRKQINNTKVWDTYTNMENIYKEFIANKSVRTYRCPTKKNWKSQGWNYKELISYSFI